MATETAGLDEGELELSDFEDSDIEDAAIVRPSGLSSATAGVRSLDPVLPTQQSSPQGVLANTRSNGNEVGQRSAESPATSLVLEIGEKGTSDGSPDIDHLPTSQSAPSSPGSKENVVVEQGSEKPGPMLEVLQTLRMELAAEKQRRQSAEEARLAAEKARTETEAAKAGAFARFKNLMQESLKQKDDAIKRLEELTKGKGEISAQYEQALQGKDEALKGQEQARAEMQQAAAVLTAEADRILTKLGQVKGAGSGQAPNPKTAGLALIVHSLKKRVEGAVEEVLKERSQAINRHEEVRGQLEQQSLQNAIDVSKLEAIIAGLKEEKVKRTNEEENWQKVLMHKDERLTDMSKQVEEMDRRLKSMEGAAAAERRRAEDAEAKIRSMEGEARKLKAGIDEHRRSAEEARQKSRDLDKIMADMLGKVRAAEAAKDKAAEERERERAGREVLEREKEKAKDEGKKMMDEMEGISLKWKEEKGKWEKDKEEVTTRLQSMEAEKVELAEVISQVKVEREEICEKLRDVEREKQAFIEEVRRLEGAIKEIEEGDKAKAEIGHELERANKEVKDAQGLAEGASKLQREAEKLWKEAERREDTERQGRLSAEEERDQALEKVALLEEDCSQLKQSAEQQERHITTIGAELDDLREEVRRRERHFAELEERHADANSQVGSLLEEVSKLQGLLADAEEECARWRAAASEEAAAGAAVVEEVEHAHQQISILTQELGQWKRAAEESVTRAQSKEEIAASAIAAKDAAERSLRIADRRAAELREQIEELRHQIQDGSGTRQEGERVQEVEPGCYQSLGQLLTPWNPLGRSRRRGPPAVVGASLDLRWKVVPPSWKLVIKQLSFLFLASSGWQSSFPMLHSTREVPPQSGRCTSSQKRHLPFPSSLALSSRDLAAAASQQLRGIPLETLELPWDMLPPSGPGSRSVSVWAPASPGGAARASRTPAGAATKERGGRRKGEDSPRKSGSGSSSDAQKAKPPPKSDSAKLKSATPAGKLAAMREFAQDERLMFNARTPAADALQCIYAYPNEYTVGICSLGYQLVWAQLATREDVHVARLFTDASDPLPREADLLGFSFSWELDYAHILAMLEDLGIPTLSAEREAHHPLVFGGGSVLTANPEPYADFFDVVLLGDGEHLLAEFLQALGATRGAPGSRIDRLRALAQVPGVYVPSLYTVEYEAPDGPILGVRPADDGVPAAVVKQTYRGGQLAVSSVVSARMAWESIFMVEVVRSCPEMCRFCLASYASLPFRVASLADSLIPAIQRGLQVTQRVGLLGASVTQHPQFEELLQHLLEPQYDAMRLSIGSVRTNTLTPVLAGALAQRGTKSVTVAVESGSARMRQIINKKEDEDVQQTVEMMRAVRKAAPSLRLTLGCSTFVPKAHTPFQWYGVRREAEQRMDTLGRAVRSQGVEFRPESYKWSVVQALLSRGDRRLSKVLQLVRDYGDSRGSFRRAFKELHGQLPPMDFYTHHTVALLPPSLPPALPITIYVCVHLPIGQSVRS
eukprot:jgi/Mesen1/7306/ME000374S06665